jgi:hypothetical protein
LAVYHQRKVVRSTAVRPKLEQKGGGDVRKYWRFAAAAVALGLAGVAGFAVNGGEPTRDLVVTPAMPCEHDEVYVWTDYPDEAGCVSGTDHEAHAGHHG